MASETRVKLEQLPLDGFGVMPIGWEITVIKYPNGHVRHIGRKIG